MAASRHAILRPMATPPEQAAALRLQTLASELARAIATERRRRRRVDTALRDGQAPSRLVARLDKSNRRVVELIGEIEPLLGSVRAAIREPVGTTQSRNAAAVRRARQGHETGGGPGALVSAAIDIGSNSVHLLVAVVSGHRLEALLDTSEFLGLGDAVDEHGAIGRVLRERLAGTLTAYVARARTLGATAVQLVGTQPLRGASDAGEAVAEIEASTGLRVIVLTHEEEALLTLLGVTAGRPVRRNLVLVDVGGGSSEVLWVPVGGDPVAAGLPLGSARLTRRIVSHDPPTPDEIVDLEREARRVMEGAPAGAPDEVVIVGGSATNLLRLVPQAAIDRRVTPARVAEALRVLGGETAAEAAARHGMREPRARTIAAGVAIVGAVLDRYDADRARVDEAGIREGLLLATTHAGADWRENLAWLAHGWSR
jgi:exopolyphosphatase/pppGpp-phosphohydrolase